MWHEARKQEKAVRHKMVDSAKRHERRRQFYESVRREPDEFMQVHGQVMPIHVDTAIAEAAESPNILRKWQGDENILIDRFDVRVHLEQIQDGTSKQTKKNLYVFQTNIRYDDVMELQCDYERYRILVFNEFKKGCFLTLISIQGMLRNENELNPFFILWSYCRITVITINLKTFFSVSENSFLTQIAAKEFWPTQGYSPSSTYKKERDKKKNMTGKRAAIAFTYGDSEVIRTSNNKYWKERNAEASSSDDDELDETEDLDPAIDTSVLNAESSALLNKIGTKYNITSGAFLQLLNMDQKEQTSTAQIKEIDKAKLALSTYYGRHAKADRAILKRRRAMIIGNLGSALQSNEEATTTLLSFLSSSNKNDIKEEYVLTSSDSGEDFERTEFITCFGGDNEKNISKNNLSLDGPDENDGEKGIIHGPVLPTKEYRRLLELSRRKSVSPDSQWNCTQDISRRERRSSRSLSPRSPRKRRRSRSRNLSTSRYQRKREREGSSRSPSYRNRRENRTRTSNTRMRSSSRSYKRRRSSYSSSHSPTSKRTSSVRNHRRNNEQSNITGLTNNNFSKTINDYSSSSLSSSNGSPINIRSSMSESEKEKIERENRKRRIKRTKRMVREQKATRELNKHQEGVEAKVEKAAKKLRVQMRKALTKTAAQFKEEGEQRHKEMLREKRFFLNS
ncbi:DRY_EERY domain-containing protein [Meloidogyne graminicola]|uniref:DRY_EERY domain-containing protein n=1 Tax=Meloidogyne graminicola TaxID=189291 RepID=A0A8S9ZZE6_9BILA|nr:DRY_EERY domain-containing protein [Meloidogyne graminicola]